MATQSVESLFAEACGLNYTPVGVSRVIAEAFDFCQQNNLDCGLEPGDEEGFYCFWIMPVEHDRWFINVQDKSITQACYTAVALSYSRLGHESDNKVVCLESFRQRRNQL